MSGTPVQNKTSQQLQTQQQTQLGQNTYAIPQQNRYMQGYDQAAMNQLMQQRFGQRPAQQQMIFPQSQQFQFNPAAFPIPVDQSSVLSSRPNWYISNQNTDSYVGDSYAPPSPFGKE